MSYNPAFVCDESPLANTDERDTSNGGIKLTSFKVLPAGPPTTTGSQQQLANAAGKKSGSKQQVVSLVPDSRDCIVDIQQQQQQTKKTKNHSRHKTTNTQQLDNEEHLSDEQIQQQQRNKLMLRQQQLAQKQAQRSSDGAPADTAAAATGATSGAAIVNNQQKSNHNHCMSTSSSLSLIDNPTLSSLTPSASSYSTTDSIVSTSGLCAAVECRDMRYDVGRGKNMKTILHDINVTVPEGSIYGLLGPSGCGKTTMLRCVVGRIKPKSGQVRVFGYQPNESGSQIPGPAIGYMPQVSNLLFLFYIFLRNSK